MQIKDLKVGTIFQMEGYDMDGNTVQADATLITKYIDKPVGIKYPFTWYVVESDPGIKIKMSGEEIVTKVYK